MIIRQHLLADTAVQTYTGSLSRNAAAAMQLCLCLISLLAKWGRACRAVAGVNMCYTQRSRSKIGPEHQDYNCCPQVGNAGKDRGDMVMCRMADGRLTTHIIAAQSGKPRKLWTDVALSDIHRPKSPCYYCVAEQKST